MHVLNPIAIAGLVLSFGGGCAQPLEEDVVATEQALSTVTSIDFSTYPVGPLGSPWAVNSTGSGSAGVVDTTADHGHALQAHFDNASSIHAETAMVANGPNLDFRFDVKPGSNTAFTLEIVGSRTDATQAYSHRTLTFEWTPSGDFLDLSGRCGSVPLGVWSNVHFLFHTDAPTKVYDAWVNGIPACTGRTFSQTFGFPTHTFAIGTSPHYVFKGNVLFDNFSVQTGSPDAP